MHVILQKSISIVDSSVIVSGFGLKHILDLYFFYELILSFNAIQKYFPFHKVHVSFISYQEHLNYVSEISQEEIFILDPELVVMTAMSTSSPTMPDLVNPTSSPVNNR